MKLTTAVAGLRAELDARRTRREQRRRLERELGGYTTAAELAELEMLMSRYSADEIREVEEALTRQAARRRTTPVGMRLG